MGKGKKENLWLCQLHVTYFHADIPKYIRSFLLDVDSCLGDTSTHDQDLNEMYILKQKRSWIAPEWLTSYSHAPLNFQQ